MRNLIPQPVFCAPGQGEFLVQPESVIVVTGDAGALDGVAQALAEMLHEVTGNRPPIHATATRHAAITLRLDPDAAAAARLGSEGYRLTITPDSVEIEHRGSRHWIANDDVIVCAGGVLPTQFLQDIGVEVETKFGTS